MSSKELRRCLIAPVLFKSYRYGCLRRYCILFTHRLEGGGFYSGTLRDILKYYHGIVVGAYSYGECIIPGRFPRGVIVGRYVSVGPGVRIFLRNHPLDRLSMHPFFYNKNLGWLGEDSISTGTLEIGHDSWIGANAIITPSCSRIGIGTVVGAGAVVTKNIEDFAVVVGNPARQIRLRFPRNTCDLILRSKWWEHSISECVQFMSEMIKPLQDEPELHSLLSTHFSWDMPGRSAGSGSLDNFL